MELCSKVKITKNVRIKLTADCTDTFGNPDPNPMTCTNFTLDSTNGDIQTYVDNTISFEENVVGKSYMYEVVAKSNATSEVLDEKSVTLTAQSLLVETP